jgi:cytosine permease
MQKVDKEFSLQAVPQGSRTGFFRMLAVMMGLTFFSASMLSGGELGAGLTFKEFIWIILAGNLILGLYTGALAFIASKTGLSTHLLARYAFGEKGSYLPSFLLGATQVGWFGVGLAMFAVPVHLFTGINEYVLIIVSGILMTATAFWGMKALTIISIIAIPAISILGGYSAINATNTAGGIQALMDYQPTEAMGIAAALTICVGSFVSAGTLTPDFTRFAKSGRTAVSTTMIAFFIGNSLMFLFGAIGTFAFGLGDISEVMYVQGLIIPAIIVLGLNIWTTNDNALYASSLGFSNITKLPKNLLVIFNGMVGTIAAMWLYNNFIGFLTILGSTLPSIGAIILADYFLVRKGKYEQFETMKFKSINWNAILAWVGGVAVANLVPGIPPINGIIGTAVIYVISMVVVEKPTVMKVEKVG